MIMGSGMHVIAPFGGRERYRALRSKCHCKALALFDHMASRRIGGVFVVWFDERPCGKFSTTGCTPGIRRLLLCGVLLYTLDRRNGTS
jgi:hypothetical protein